MNSLQKTVKAALSMFLLCSVVGTMFSCGNKNNEGGNQTEEPEINTYSFMNCDTGRMLSLNGNEYFEVIDNGNGSVTLKDETTGKFVSFDENGAFATDEKIEITLNTENKYERYRFELSGKVVIDNDEGTTNVAVTSLADVSNDTLQTGWYMTKKGDKLPLRFVVYGDSISNGANPDLPAGSEKTGCRKELSTLLLEKYGRVVAVGSTKVADGDGENRNTLITDNFMYRHEGHNGWVITSQDGYAEVNNYGIDTLRENLQKKYCPDVICMMIGVNDINQLNPLFVAKDVDDIRTKLVERYMVLVKAIINDLPSDGVLVCGTVTPMRSSADSWNNMANQGVEAFNTTIFENAEYLNKRGEKRITVSDNYNAIKTVGFEGVSSDNGHLSAKGYSAMANSYFNAIVNYYGE